MTAFGESYSLQDDWSGWLVLSMHFGTNLEGLISIEWGLMVLYIGQHYISGRPNSNSKSIEIYHVYLLY